MFEERREVAPVRPAAAYIGGKRRLGEMLARRIEAVPHETYAEPFVGMGGVFLRRRWAPRREVINDVSRDVATLFRILQRHYPQFMETLKFQIASRAEFERLAACNVETLTDLERAARFLYLQRMAFGGKVSGRAFGVEPTGGARFDVTKLGPQLEAIHERLSSVVIECLQWSDFIDRYDGPGTLFYLDPPYWGSEADYGTGVFGPSDFGLIAQRLSSIAGRFMLSVNDVPETRQAFARFGIEPVSTRYTISGKWMDVAEILVTGPSSEPLPVVRDLLSL
ncbi:DNA adenine methylase [Bradyrhizobium sp. HKCCYLRH3059]|uniref:DNA adenine methylase n=1 Tax=Bradyrhizobium sp. HKCCYLRH3059 TaxID=3420745 RepID=UPI003EB8C703